MKIDDLIDLKIGESPYSHITLFPSTIKQQARFP